MTVGMLWREGTKQLDLAGIEEASLDAWYLLEHITGITKSVYYMNPSQEIDTEMEKQYYQVIESRAKRIPLQHITGVQSFMGYEFFVNESVLIPRQDTEVLVETALEFMEPQSRILDLCTGSGCILLSLMKLGGKCGKYPKEGIGTDISEDALKVARENAVRLQVPALFSKSDLLEQVTGVFDIIVSNPPYIASEEIQKLQEEVKFHDPFQALDGGADGLCFYRKIIDQAGDHMRNGGWLFFEIGYDQGEAVSELMRAKGYCNVMIKKDLAGLDRVVYGMYDNKSDRQ